MPSISHAGLVGGSDALDVEMNVWMRNGRRTRAWAALAVVWSAACVVLLTRTGELHGDLTTVGYAVFGVFYLGMAGLGLLLGWRVARSGLWIGADGIVVRGPFRTRSVALADAGRFAPGLQGRGGNGTPCPMLQRTGTRAVGVWALGRRNIWFRYERLCREIQPLCDELNQLIARVR